jgi:hypothetical protein
MCVYIDPTGCYHGSVDIDFSGTTVAYFANLSNHTGLYCNVAGSFLRSSSINNRSIAHNQIING